MNGYFTPWRRKIGVALLAPACLFSAVWVRSMFDRDDFGNGIISHDGGISRVVWMSWSSPNGECGGLMEQISWRIPYWSITVPLTLLSAWSLLSRPRQDLQPANHPGPESAKS